MTSTRLNTIRRASADSRSGRFRRASTAGELIVSMVLLSAALGVTSKLIVASSGARREAERRQVALHEAANALERLSAHSADTITPERAAEQGLSESASQSLPAGKLTVELTDEPGPPAARRIAVVVSWNLRSGEPAAPVRLTGWVFFSKDRP